MSEKEGDNIATLAPLAGTPRRRAGGEIPRAPNPRGPPKVVEFL